MASSSFVFKVFLGTLVFSFVGSALSRWAHLDPGPIGGLCSAVLVISGALLVLRELTGPLRYALLFFGAAVEIVGMYAGWIFGSYHYTSAWAPILPLPGGQPFPLLVPFAWVFMAGSSFLAVRKSDAPFWTIPAAALAALLDAPMERAMTSTFGYWTWLEPALPFGAPLQNTIGWFLTSLIASLLMSRCVRTGADLAEAPLALGGFCLFVAFSGALTGFDLAWPILATVSLIPIFIALRPTIFR